MGVLDVNRFPTCHVLEAVLWILNTGAQWHMLPQSYPNYKTVHRRFQTWCCHEILRRVLTDVANELRDRGALDEKECFIDATFVMAKGGGSEIGPTKRGKGMKIMAIVDRHGLPGVGAEHFAACMRELATCIILARTHSRGARQPVDPFTRRALPDFSTRPSTTHPAPPGVPLRPQARQLAQHGGDRDRRPGPPMPRSTHRQLRSARRRNRSLAKAAQRRTRSHQMDVHNRKSPHQNGPRLSQTYCQISPTSKSQNLCDEVLDDQFHEPDHGTGDLLVDSSFAVR